MSISFLPHWLTSVFLAGSSSDWLSKLVNPKSWYQSFSLSTVSFYLDSGISITLSSIYTMLSLKYSLFSLLAISTCLFTSSQICLMGVSKLLCPKWNFWFPALLWKRTLVSLPVFPLSANDTLPATQILMPQPKISFLIPLLTPYTARPSAGSIFKTDLKATHFSLSSQHRRAFDWQRSPPDLQQELDSPFSVSPGPPQATLPTAARVIL